MNTSALTRSHNFMKKFVSIAIWTSIAAIVLWSMTAGTMDVLGFKKCEWCGEWVRGKSEYRVIKDRYVTCNECLEQGRIGFIGDKPFLAPIKEKQ